MPVGKGLRGTYPSVGKVSDTRFSLGGGDAYARARYRRFASTSLLRHADDSGSSNRVTGVPRNARRSFPIRLNGRRLVLPGYTRQDLMTRPQPLLFTDTAVFPVSPNGCCVGKWRAAAPTAARPRGCALDDWQCQLRKNVEERFKEED